MIDETDLEIIKLLGQNSRMQLQEIGSIVHLTGQAVKNRITRLEKLGVIEGYTIKKNMAKLGCEISAFVTIFLKSNNHAGFLKFIRENIYVKEADRISGDGCYLLKVTVSDNPQLEEFLEKTLEYGNYKVNLSISKLK